MIEKQERVIELKDELITAKDNQLVELILSFHQLVELKEMSFYQLVELKKMSLHQLATLFRRSSSRTEKLYREGRQVAVKSC